jgi:hypothetical protein
MEEKKQLEKLVWLGFVVVIGLGMAIILFWIGYLLFSRSKKIRAVAIISYGVVSLLVLYGGIWLLSNPGNQGLKNLAQPFRSYDAILYSMDNLVAVGVKAQRHAPGDPEHMTIALRSWLGSHPGPPLFRIQEDGNGIPVKVIDGGREWYKNKPGFTKNWVMVRLEDGRVGWVERMQTKNLHRVEPGGGD